MKDSARALDSEGAESSLDSFLVLSAESAQCYRDCLRANKVINRRRQTAHQSIRTDEHLPVDLLGGKIDEN